MNIAGLLGLIAAIAITSFSILDSTSNPKIFLDIHGIVIVIGGTITVALLSFNFKKLSSAMKILFRKMFGRERDDFHGTIKLLVELAEINRTNPKGMQSAIPEKAHPFLKDAMNLVIGYGFSPDQVDEILTNGIRGKTKRDEEENKVWHTIGRFPPAFGLLGATLGMISLLQTLGEPGAQDRIGPAMATALIATFYGLVCANLIFLPIAEKLAAVASSDRIMRMIIKEGVLKIVEKEHPTFIAEYLNSFLPPGQRMALDAPAVEGAKRAA